MPLEGTGVRRKNTRTSGASFAAAPRATQSTQLVRNAVPNVQSAGAGLEGLSGVFSSFFGGVNKALDTVAAAEHARELGRIEQENKTQQAEAYKLAFDGTPLSAEQQQDLDYVSTYDKALGRRYGAELASKYTEGLNALPYDQDVEAFTEKFVKDNLKNGVDVGTGNALFDAELMGTFKGLSDPVKSKWRESAAKASNEMARQTLGATIAETFSEIEPSDIQGHVADMRTLSPLDPARAPGDVVVALMDGAGNDPTRIQKVITLLNSPGSGDNGKSFAQSFPGAALDIEARLTQRYLSGLNMEASLAYEDVGKAITLTDDPATLFEIVAPGGELDRLREQHGKGGQYDSLWNAAVTKLEKLKDKVVTGNLMVAMRSKDAPLDESLVKKNLGTYLKERDIDWVQNPEAAAAEITAFSYVTSGDLQQEMSAALSGASPERFAAAIRFGMAIENTGGEARALSMFTSDAAADYLYAKRQARYSGKPIEEVVLDLQKGRTAIENADKAQWKNIVGADNAADAAETVQEEILDALQDAVGGDVVVDPVVMADLMATAKQNHMVRNRGQTDWAETVADTAKVAARNMSLFPGPNGTVMAEPTLVPRAVPATDAFGRVMLDKDGKPTRQELVPFGRDVWNAEGGVAEDTIKTWEQDAVALRNVMPGTSGVNDPSRMSLDGRSAWAAKGVWLVRGEAGGHVMFGLGQKYTVGGKVITIPEDPSAASAMLAEIDLFDTSDDTRPVEGVDQTFIDSPAIGTRTQANADAIDRFRLVPFPEDGSLGFILGYVPGFRTKPLPTAEERERAWALENNPPIPGTKPARPAGNVPPPGDLSGIF